VDLLLTFAVADIWGFLLLNPYWLLGAFGKTPNISHATTTGLESAGEKQLNSTAPELIENLLFLSSIEHRFAKGKVREMTRLMSFKKPTLTSLSKTCG
jgi:hypothetical protein